MPGCKDPMTTSPTRRAALRRAERRTRNRVWSMSPEVGDAVLYGLSALFALITIVGSNQALYRQWAELAIGPFLFGTVCAVVLAVVNRRPARASDETTPPRLSRRSWTTRIGLAVFVFAGATAIPL